MSIGALLAELRGRDIELWCEGEQLRCNAPAGALTAELRDELRVRKAEILAFLRAAQAQASEPRAIVPLRKGGTLAPVFAVPGHNGDVFCYRTLVQSLAKEQPFYGLQPPGVDGRSEPLENVEQLAAYFARQIRAIQPKGTFIIAGFCAGGAIAFELAQQLVAGGAPLEYIALFGSPYPVYFGFARQLRERVLRRIKGTRKHLAALARGNWKYLARKWRGRKARYAAPQDPVLRFRDAVERATVRAVRRYRPRTFAGELKLFLPSPSWARSNLALRWRRVALKTEVYYGLEGYTNDNMLLAPQASLFAALFRRASSRQAPESQPQRDHPHPLAKRAA